MSRDIMERATPGNVTEWMLEKMRRHQAETCKCAEGDPCVWRELLEGPLTSRFVREFRRAEGIDE